MRINLLSVQLLFSRTRMKFQWDVSKLTDLDSLWYNLFTVQFWFVSSVGYCDIHALVETFVHDLLSLLHAGIRHLVISSLFLVLVTHRRVDRIHGVRRLSWFVLSLEVMQSCDHRRRWTSPMKTPPYLTVSNPETPFGGGSCRGLAVAVGFAVAGTVVGRALRGGVYMVTLGSVRGATESFKISRLVTTSSADNC